MKWAKLGLVFGADGSAPWTDNSALQPTPFLLDPSTIRVFAGFRDVEGISRVGFVDVAADCPNRVLRVSREPVLDIGAPGRFDESGVVPCAVLRRGKALLLYYAGYLLPRRARFTAFGGLAVSEDEGLSFYRHSEVPLTDRTDEAPLFRVIHSLLEEGGRFRTWYGAGGHFIQGAKKSLPVYDIRYMESHDGLSYPKTGRPVLAPAGNEHRVGRPYVVKWHDGRYLMFYGFGTERMPYRIGLAVSPDGLEWKRIDHEVGISPSESGWDSEMIAYPAIARSPAATFMFYNGNNYGRDGFGVARLESE